MPKSFNLDRLRGKEICGCNPLPDATQAAVEAWPRCTVCGKPQLLHGLGSALKPAHEPILMAQKPFSGTIIKNVLEYGTGALNIDGCRVEHITVGDGNLAPNPHLRTHINGGNGGHILSTETERRVVVPNQLGRWPANICHDGSGEVLEAFPDAQGQLAPPVEDGTEQNDRIFGAMKHGGPHHIPRVEEDKNASRVFNTLRDGEATADKRYTEKGSTSFSMLPGQRRFDTGSPARFFYTAKPSRKERNLGLDSERFPKGNEHTTVKPLALLRWLQRLVTPPGGTTLDPFLGSGTSAMAAAQEGFNFIGIELDPQWLPVQIARTLAASPDTTIVSENEVTQ